MMLFLSCCLYFSCHLLFSQQNERKQKKHQHVRFSRKSGPLSERERACEADEGVARVTSARSTIMGSEGSRRESADSLLSLHAQNNILMKESPDRTKCPRRVALPNCGFPRPSAAGYFRPSPSKVQVCSTLSDQSHYRPQTISTAVSPPPAAFLSPTLIK